MPETAISELLRPAAPCTVVIFGAAGDLTKRKLIPALYNLKSNGLLPREFAVVGVTRKPKSHEQFREEMSQDIHDFATVRVDEPLWKELRDALYYQSGEFTDPAVYAQLATLLGEVATSHRTGGNILFYLAVPPSFFGEIVRRLADVDLCARREGPGGGSSSRSRSAATSNRRHAAERELRAVLPEGQIYRIDHYLGKETVQNILAFRFANGIFEPVWNRRYIDHVQITVAETLGVEGRGGYYETAGVLRDMIQNHMFQLLALVAMEPPCSFDADARARREGQGPERDPADAARGDPAAHGARAVRRGVRERQKRARLPRGAVGRRPPRATETYAAFKLDSTTGGGPECRSICDPASAWPSSDTEIVIQFRRPPLLAFGRGSRSRTSSRTGCILRSSPKRGSRSRSRRSGPGATMNLTARQPRLQLLRFRAGRQGDRVRATALRRDDRRHDALPPRRHGRGGMADRDADPRRLGIDPAARLPELRRGLVGPGRRGRAHEARRPGWRNHA